MTASANSRTTRIRLSKGLDLPLAGAPQQKIAPGPPIRQVAVVAEDFIGIKPSMAVQEGDEVKLGQLLFEDKKTNCVVHTAPAAGRVVAIHRGEKRKFQSLVIEVGGDAEEEFPTFTDHYLYNLDPDKVRENLTAAGIWPALRKRPYGKAPNPNSSPSSIFVTAIDTNPLAPDPVVVLQQPQYPRWFTAGLQVLSTLTDGPLYLCTAAGANIPGTDEDCVRHVEFAGPHPAGLAGTHIHYLDPVSESKTVWYIGYQDVVAIGHLFLMGRLLADRTISLAGPSVTNPRLLRTRLGASLTDLTADAQEGDDVRIISGSVLSGRRAVPPSDFLGRFHNQVTILSEGRQREFIGWTLPGFNKFSVTRAFASRLLGLRRLPLTTSTEGSVRAVVPIGSYEKVMPLDIVATPLMKALLVQDTETAQALGCLELEEEDLALCTFACPGKNAYGPLLRKALAHIEAEG